MTSKSRTNVIKQIFIFQENNKFGREKKDLPMNYQREIDKKGIGNTYDLKCSFV